jgi:uncharacterized protein YqjF (DUF2071 family)
VAPGRLEGHLPPGLELETREGRAFISLVAFDFLDTRVLGIPWPGYRDFPEINLRFYVRRGDRRGVVFLREYVPKRLIATIARAIYNEPYRYAPMSSRWRPGEGGANLVHSLTVGGRVHRLEVDLGAEAHTPPEESTAHFFKEHSWGFGRDRRGRLLEYEVRHPVWEVVPVRGLELDWDFGMVYGDEWADLGEREPDDVTFALGSEIRVYPHGRSSED